MKLHSKDLDAHMTEADNRRLRGARVNQISQDLKDSGPSHKEKVLTYSSHLSWMLKSVERLYKLMESARSKANQSTYTHGMANGLIMAFAVFLEEQGDIPFVKAPAKYTKQDLQVINELTSIYIYNLERLIYNILSGDENGPAGYPEAENAFAAWGEQALQIISDSPVEDKRLGEIRQRIREYMKSME